MIVIKYYLIGKFHTKPVTFSQALKDEGLDPETYQFEINEKKPSKRLSVSSK